MDTGCYDTSDALSVFKSWSYSPDACLLQLASLHVKSFWNPTFGKRRWILQDYIEYNHIFTQLEMLLKEKARCVLKINVGVIVDIVNGIVNGIVVGIVVIIVVIIVVVIIVVIIVVGIVV